MKEVKACIFDLDGVIVDTAKYHYQSWNTIAQKLGFSFTWEENEKLKGVSRIDSLEIILKIGKIDIHPDKKAKLLIEKNDLYLDFIKNMNIDEVLPGVHDFLKHLTSKNIKIAVGSASKNARPILKKTGLLHFFQAIVDGNEVKKGKPDPEVFMKGAKLLNINPDECIVFEDSQSGIQAANTGGFISIGIGNPIFLEKARLVISGFENLTLPHLVSAVKGG